MNVTEQADNNDNAGDEGRHGVPNADEMNDMEMSGIYTSDSFSPYETSLAAINRIMNDRAAYKKGTPDEQSEMQDYWRTLSTAPDSMDRFFSYLDVDHIATITDGDLEGVTEALWKSKHGVPLSDEDKKKLEISWSDKEDKDSDTEDTHTQHSETDSEHGSKVSWQVPRGRANSRKRQTARTQRSTSRRRQPVERMTYRADSRGRRNVDQRLQDTIDGPETDYHYMVELCMPNGIYTTKMVLPAIPDNVSIFQSVLETAKRSKVPDPIRLMTIAHGLYARLTEEDHQELTNYDKVYIEAAAPHFKGKDSTDVYRTRMTPYKFALLVFATSTQFKSTEAAAYAPHNNAWHDEFHKHMTAQPDVISGEADADKKGTHYTKRILTMSRQMTFIELLDRAVCCGALEKGLVKGLWAIQITRIIHGIKKNVNGVMINFSQKLKFARSAVNFKAAQEMKSDTYRGMDVSITLVEYKTGINIRESQYKTKLIEVAEKEAGDMALVFSNEHAQMSRIFISDQLSIEEQCNIALEVFNEFMNAGMAATVVLITRIGILQLSPDDKQAARTSLVQKFREAIPKGMAILATSTVVPAAEPTDATHIQKYTPAPPPKKTLLEFPTLTNAVGEPRDQNQHKYTSYAAQLSGTTETTKQVHPPPQLQSPDTKQERPQPQARQHTYMPSFQEQPAKQQQQVYTQQYQQQPQFPPYIHHQARDEEMELMMNTIMTLSDKVVALSETVTQMANSNSAMYTEFSNRMYTAENYISQLQERLTLLGQHVPPPPTSRHDALKANLERIAALNAHTN